MDFLANKKYLISFSINGRMLTFECNIISDDGDFITFIDKYGKKLTYNKLNIISSEEVG